LSGLLITGASGLVGGELLARLMPARPGVRIYILARDPARVPARFRGPQVSILAGDMPPPAAGSERLAGDGLAPHRHRDRKLRGRYAARRADR
jgi:uncharacterized protein YbjT (DUF2867 family)